jgi:hypothetical protein
VNPQNDAAILKKYKKIIEDEFFPEYGFGDGRLSVAKKAISEYKKVSTNLYNIADIMLYYVEQGVQFTKTYGDIDEPFYNSMESVYSQALKFMAKHSLCSKFQNRCKKIVNDTYEMGWGFHDSLNEMYENIFSSNQTRA